MAAAAKTDDKKKAIALRALGRQAVPFRKARADARKAQDKMDANIRAAREAGNTYREIAATVDMSTAWVQNALHRSGYRPDPR
jgi:hypothetical protein